MSAPGGTELPSVRDVIHMLQEIREELAVAVRALAEADETVTFAKEAEEMARARILIELGDEGTVSERDAIAKVRTEDLRFARVIAEQQHRSAKERVSKCDKELRAVQSLNSAVNTEWRTQAMGQPS